MNQGWPRVKELFSAALELELQDRASFLQTECAADEGLRGEVLALLAAHESSGNFIQQSAFVDVGLVTQTDPTNAIVGQQIGSYKVIRELGRGGMGVVYLAARADESFDKQVALKLIKRGMDSDAIVKRFVMERQILADLDHPNIARLIDGGTTEDGLPYFVLEYVEGANIKRYCDEHRLNTTERLTLFRPVCAAVEFAHRNLIVHRDLKPSNIIVTEDGTPKLLDFGIAKLLSGHSSVEATATIGRVLTPEYASPEELRGLPVTTSSDVYSLGVVLYELLSGHRPFNFESRSPEEVERMIIASEPIKPSVMVTRIEPARETDNAEHISLTPKTISDTRDGSIERLHRRLVGDLDNILLKALRKEPERRYTSIQEFSEDLRRHLEGLPVTASPDTLRYRARKFTQRHKAAVLAAAIVIVTLVSATALTAWQARVARRERDRAERRFTQVRTLAKSVLFEYHDGIEKLPGSTPLRERMIKDAIVYLDNLSAESSGDPTLQAELATAYEKVGDVQGNPFFANLGNQDGSLVSYRKALAIREMLYTTNHTGEGTRLELGNDYKRVADVLWAKGENDAALLNYRKAKSTFEELVQAEPTNPQYISGVGLALSGIAHVQTQSGDFKGALDSYRQCLANAEALQVIDPNGKNNARNIAVGNLKVGDSLLDVLDFSGALLHYEKSVEGFSRLAASDENNAAAARELGLSYARVALAYNKLHQYEKAVEFHLKAIEQQKQVAAADPNNVQSHFDIATTYQNLGESYLQIKKFDNAAVNVREAIRILRETFARNPDYSQGRGYLGVTYETNAEVLLAQGDTNGAIENFRKALNLLEQEPVRSAQTSALAKVYSGMGNADQVRAHQARRGIRQISFLSEARGWYQKSVDVWHGLDQQGKLIGEDRAQLTEVIQKLDGCSAALSKLKAGP
jgi:serine/threonine protein kinase/type II secretory pathway pseudopilin PulG/predicted negative regulator of RcsB-dependent stress response